MRDRIVIMSAVCLLSGMLVLTLAPLILMFYTSFKPTGTLFQRTGEVSVADFEVGGDNPARFPT